LKGDLKPIVNEAGIKEGIVQVSYTDAVKQEVRDLVSQAEQSIKNNELLKFLSQFPEPLK